MMNARKTLILAVAFIAVFTFVGPVTAQTSAETVQRLIIEKDRAFWSAYNKCDTAAFPSMFTDDVEFYHDKGGPTNGREKMINALKTGLCSNPDSRLRREEVTGTVQVYPMAKNGMVYGAVISGEHVFYVTQKGKPEFLDGRARFMQLWLLRGGEWKMARILSYDHRPATGLKK